MSVKIRTGNLPADIQRALDDSYRRGVIVGGLIGVNLTLVVVIAATLAGWWR